MRGSLFGCILQAELQKNEMRKFIGGPMLRCFLPVFIALFALVFSGGWVHAQSLSDLNVSAFESLSKGEAKRAPTSPFAPSVSTAEDLTLEDLVLTGIVMNESRAYALISGYLVERGDRIGGFKVDVIEKGRVILRRMDEVYVLTMGGL